MKEANMQFNTKMEALAQSINIMNIEKEHLSAAGGPISEAWKKIAPFWPLKNLIAANPLQGLEELPFEQAITTGQAYFQQATLPPKMEEINRETIKWCQAFFDEGQATINMPFRDQGLYSAWRQLVQFDKRLHRQNAEHGIWLANLPSSAEQTIAECLVKLHVPFEKSSLFLTLVLTTLPGWASYIKYKTEWNKSNKTGLHPVTQADYLAMRLVITCLVWPEAINLLLWHQNTHTISASEQMKKIINAENNYQTPLLDTLSKQALKGKMTNGLPLAQFVFCIDVRSEPFRRALEAQANYETFGFAGFFGIPAQIKNELTEESYSSCPVLLEPKHTVKEKIICSNEISEKVFYGRKQIKNVKHLYQALKYTFTTPFALVEAMGPWSGLWMSLKTMMPKLSMQLKRNLLEIFQPTPPVKPLLTNQDDINGIPFNDQCAYAEGALRMMGLTDNFSPLVILCGHGSATQNNAYASILDCGACGGHHGAANARILAEIINNQDVRKYLTTKHITIPSETKFIAALHNTTTDEFTFFIDENDNLMQELNQIKFNLEAARKVNSRWRCQQMGYTSKSGNPEDYVEHVKNRSLDWAQTRPEWGLARNASFIIAPRSLTKEIDLNGRTFLHSYDWQQDPEGTSLTTILTAPLIVAQWINSQYLFSSLDNTAYGSGNKITQNVSGKIGIMQGNGSDLMHGLPLQSICASDSEAYHEPLRLMAIVNAPHIFVNKIISHQVILQKLFGNGWMSLICIEPDDGSIYHLQRDLTWTKKPKMTLH